MLEDALEQYPATRQLDGGLECVVRPLEAADEGAFLAFLHAVPEIERMFIKQRLGSARFRKEWFRDLDYDKALPLVAIAHGHIIGSATLQQRLGGWKRHIARVHSLTHPEYRDVGVRPSLFDPFDPVSPRSRGRQGLWHEIGRAAHGLVGDAA